MSCIFIEKTFDAIVENLFFPIIDSMSALETSRYLLHFDNLPSSANGLKIVHITDLHNKYYGKYNHILLNKIIKEKPDCVVMTGDMLSHELSNYDNFLVFMQKLTKKVPVFYVNGNHECSDFPTSGFSGYNHQLERFGAVCLDNCSTTFRGIRLHGISYALKYYRGIRQNKLNWRDFTAECMEHYCGKKTDEFTLLLAHNPADFPVYSKWGANLTFAGHIHGGFIRLPFVGGIISPELKLFPKYQAGVYAKGKNKLVVSRGLGRIRFFNPPEIVTVTLKKR